LAEEIAMGDHAAGRDVAWGIGKRRQRRPWEFLDDHDVDSHAIAEGFPIHVHVCKHAGGVQTLACDVEGVGEHGIADGNSSD
jgi:hypothetical protein